MWRRRPARSLAAATLAVLTLGVTAVPALAAPRDQQWYLDQINVAQAQRTARGDGVTIGLLTNGRPVDHPDLAGRILPTMRVDHGLWDSVEEAPADYPLPDATATAQIGLMTARGGPGLLGVAPAAKVRPVICPGLAEDTDRCLRWLADSGVGVIDFSQAQFGRLGADFDGIRYALAKDVVVVMALNDGAQLPPAQRAGVVLVGGVDRDGRLPASARPDSRVSLRAPGPDAVGSPLDHQVIGLDPAAKDGSGYGQLSTVDGDRIAAALVAGVAALVRSKYPEMKAPSVINRLVGTATDSGAPGRDNSYGYGVVDADAALTRATPDVTANPLGAPAPPGSPSLVSRPVAIVAAVAVVGFLVVIAVVGLLIWRRRAARSARR